METRFRTPFRLRDVLLFVCVLCFLRLAGLPCASLAEENDERNSVARWNVVFYAPWKVDERSKEIGQKIDDFKRVLKERSPDAKTLFFSPFEPEERRATCANLQTLLKLFVNPNDDIIGPTGTLLPKLRSDKNQKIDLRFFICATTENGALIFPNEETTIDVDDNFWEQARGVNDRRGVALDFVVIFSCLHDVGSDRTPDPNRPLEPKDLKIPDPSDLVEKTFEWVSNNSIRDGDYFSALIDVFNGKADGNDGSRRDGTTSTYEALQYFASYQRPMFQNEENLRLVGGPYYFADSKYGKERPADSSLLLNLADQLNSLNSRGNENLLRDAKTRACQIALNATPTARLGNLTAYDAQFRPYRDKIEWKGKLEVVDLKLRRINGRSYEYVNLKNGDGARFWVLLSDFKEVVNMKR